MIKYYVEFLDENKNFGYGFYSEQQFRDFNLDFEILKVQKIKNFLNDFKKEIT